MKATAFGHTSNEDRRFESRGDHVTDSLSRKEQLSKRIENQAMELLKRHPGFHGRVQFVRFHYRGRKLLLEGWLPTYYLKQLAQEALRELKGVERIENRIVVASPIGEIWPPLERVNESSILGGLACPRPR